MRNQYFKFLICALFLCIGYLNVAKAQTNVCYAVAEDNAAPNTLFVFENNAWSQVGVTGTAQLEAIAVDPSTGVIYAANAGTLGTLDPNDGDFTAIGSVGNGNGANGNVAFDDIDGLTWDDDLGILWASNREEGVGANDLLLRIDPATGAAIGGAFFGDDYAVVEEAFDGTLAADVFDIDDIAWNPITGELFAIQNEDGPGVISIINKLDGSLEQIIYDSSDQDLEGLGFDSEGDLYATSGNNGSTGTQNSFIQIDFNNQTSSLLSQIDPTGNAVDFESFDCYRAPEPEPIPVTDVCYAVAEDNSAPNTLFKLENGIWSEVGVTGTAQLEAIAVDPNTAIVYAAEGGVLGTLNPNTALFTAIGSVGSGNGANGNVAFDDIDGLTWDDNLGILWASNREGGAGENDLLLQIDPATGAAIAGAFAGSDYVVVEEAFDNTLAADVYDVDDIAWNPATSELFAIQNEDGPGVISIIDKTDGSLIQIVYDSSDQDLEGLGFDTNGNLYATSGDNGGVANQNSFLQIDYLNQNSVLYTEIDPTGNAVDFESFDCYRILSPNPVAGSLTANTPVCMVNGSASITANHIVNPTVPAGFQVAYVLTTGAGLVIQEIDQDPQFTVNAAGDYTMHTLVYDPNTLDVNFLVLGVTTGFDINAVLTQGGGQLAGALDILGAPVTVLPATNAACLCNDNAIVQQSYPYYAVAEDNAAPNTLWRYDEDFGWTEIGVTGSASIEAIAANPVDNILYAIDGGTFGTLNTTTGLFTSTTAVGTGNGANGAIAFDDIDGLTYDAANDILWATQRIGGTGAGTNDLLLQINPNTGTFVSGVFGGADYAVIEEVFDGTLGGEVYDVDDIALNPYTGQLFAIQNQDGPGLITILNTTNGEIDQIIYDTPDEDLEGLGFDIYGNLYATSGDNGDSGAQNSFIQIDYVNGISNVIGAIDPAGQSVDFESFDSFSGFHDLSLTTSLAPNQAATVNTGDNVVYELVVSNQGQYVVNNVTIENLIGPNFTLVPGDDFTLNGNGNGVAVLDCALEPGESESLFITLNANVACDNNGGNNAVALGNSADIINANSFYSIPGAGFVPLTDLDVNNGNNVGNATVNVLPGNLAVNSTIANESCAGNDGAIFVTSNGQAPYTYLWSNGATTQNLTNVQAGTYSLLVTDANGCTNQLNNLVVGQDQNIAISSTNITNTFCGSSNGAINIALSGGTAPYSYSWSNGNTTQNLSNLASGNYTVTVTDANGCTGTATYPINNTDVNLNVSTNITDASCNAASDGAISLNVSNGVAPYSYIWSTGATTQNISNLPSGNYGLIVTDANGCSSPINGLMVNENSSIAASASNITNAICGSSNGAININTTGGLAPYSYVWSNGSTTEDIANLTAGNYTVVITDANGCVGQQTFAVTNDNNANINLTNYTVQNVTCSNLSNGAINLTVNGGTAPYSYVWSNGTTTEDLSNLAAGNYSVMVTDANGCSANSGNIQISQPSNLNIIGSTTDAIDLSAGSIVTTVTGGNAPYSYLWSNGSTTANINNLQGGSYTLVVTDANGCTAAQNFTINQACNVCVFDLSLTKDLTPGQSLDYGGSVSAGDDVSYTITVVNQGDYDAQNVVIADYVPNGLTLSTNDNNGWSPGGFGYISNTLPLILAGQTASVQAVFTVSPTFTFGSISNSAEIVSNERTDGVTAIDVDSNPDSNNSNDFIAEDDYDNAIIFVTPSVPPVAGSLTTQANICIENGFGSILAIPDGNTFIPGGAALLYLLVDATAGVIADANTTPDFLVTTFGQYSVHTFVYDISDFNPASIVFGTTTASSVISAINSGAISADLELPGASVDVTSCIADLSLLMDLGNNQSAIVSTNEIVEFVITVTNQGVFPMQNIQVTDYVPNGLILAGNNPGWFLNNGNYTYILPGTLQAGEEEMISIFFEVDPSFEGQIIDNFAEINYAENLDGTLYSDIDSQPDAILGNDPIQEDDFDDASILIIGVTCNVSITGANITDSGCGNLGTIALTVAGGTGSYLYSWSNGTSLPTATGLAPGAYTVTVSDSQGCNATEVYTVNSSGSNLTVNGTVFDAGCNSFGGVNTAVSGGVAPYTYSWSNGSNNANISGVSSGTYSVNVSDASGCTGFANFVVNNTGNSNCVFDLALQQSFINNNSVVYNIGDDVTYIVTVTNQGDFVANNVSIIDYIPAGLILNDNDWTLSGGNAIYNIPQTIPPGSSVAVAITLSVSPNANCGSIKNAAEIVQAYNLNGSSTNDVDSTPDSNEFNDGIPTDDEVNNANNDEDDHDIGVIYVDCPEDNIDLSLNKTVNPAIVAVGGTATYTITVSNSTLGNATGISVLDQLPSGVTYLSDNSFGAYNVNSGIWNVGNLLAGQSASINITCIINNHSTAINTAQIMTHVENDIDSTPGNGIDNEDDQDSATPIPPAVQNVDLALSLNATPISVEAVGDLVTWTLIVSNQSNATATGVTVLNNLPSSLTYMSDNGNGAYNSNTGLWNIGTVPAGANAVLQITTMVSSLNNLTSYAQIATTTETDVDSTPGNNSNFEDDDDTATLIVDDACSNIINTCTQPITPVEICVTFCDAPNAVITDVQTLFDCSIDYLPNGCIEYTPLPGLTITDEITITGSDSFGNTDVATAFVDIGCDGNFSNNEEEEVDVDAEELQQVLQEETTNPFKVTYSQIFGDVITVDFENNNDELVDYQLMSIDGKLINYGTAEAITGMNRFHIQDVNVVTGLYVIILNNGKEIISHKMLLD